MDLDAFLRSQARQQGSQLLFGPLQPIFIGVTQVHAEGRLARNHVDQIRFESHAAGGCQGPVDGDLAQPADHGAGDPTRVPAQVHGRRAGMVGAALDGHLLPGDALQALDHPDLYAFGFQDRPLFDVQLQVFVR
ncbi:hypothetical protein D9M70_631200 [compost metagenome]